MPVNEIKKIKIDSLTIKVFNSVDEMAEAGAIAFEQIYSSIKKDFINSMFAGAESQIKFQKNIAKSLLVDWSRINAFNIDDYLDAEMNPEFSVGALTNKYLYSKVAVKETTAVVCNADDSEAEQYRFNSLLKKSVMDICCIGVGESGHLGLNEIGQTDFNDQQMARIVTIPEKARQQLVNDEFLGQGAIPYKGLTATIPVIMQSNSLLVFVPFENKASIVSQLLRTAISEDLPASIIRKHKNAILFLDKKSASEIGDLL